MSSQTLGYSRSRARIYKASSLFIQLPRNHYNTRYLYATQKKIFLAIARFRFMVCNGPYKWYRFAYAYHAF